MASSTHDVFLSAVVLILSIFAATTTATSILTCYEGMGLPIKPLQGCRHYVASQTCGGTPRLPISVMKERCCRELASITWNCRCAGVLAFMDREFPRGLMDIPGCPTQVQRDFARILATTGQCNLRTIHGGPFCLFDQL